MDLQQENDSEQNLAKDSRRQQRKGKGMKSSILQTEQQISSVGIKIENACQDLQWNNRDDHCKDSPSPPEKLIAGILGVTCLILYILVRTILLHNLSPAYPCGHCPPEWIRYSNNCYYISTEQKTWTESWMACAAKNSNLLYVDNEEEMNFLNIFNKSPWIGLSHRNNNSWAWKNGSMLSFKKSSKTSKLENCAFGDFDTQKVYFVSCLENRSYVCKHQAH
ncbi:NKG2-A/NKG2-B type II integral membrane protein-like [Pteronotus mesoamericanus]|uniref:NKG2-A/NKG2-B type II integral membrane protein-like n=1 Tax=Pteronotus mesoamericanus TaxID=1884717 RepID=UPI0023EC86D4|nr:NKG2-A/NKG2-B type II integral membrane protein-like [Pteronotus parnellii mesoamericanus]